MTGDELAERVAAALGAAVVEVGRLSGGDVADSYRMVLDDGTPVFAKTHRRPPPHFFRTEAAGLRWLRDSGAVSVPEVLAVEEGLLALEWVDEGRPRAATEEELGRSLALLHGSGAPCFGREDRMTTGSRRLPNEPTGSWAEFYSENRLLPLARLGRESAALPDDLSGRLEALAGRLAALAVPEEPPARLHGDLWAGNRLVDVEGRSWLIDPAAHGGHREFDLAMMRLFGGFGSATYTAYEEVRPLAEGWEDRVPLHQLAPLAVHAIKFGGGYVGATARALDACDRL